MSYSYSPRTRLGHQAASPSPLRQTSTASNGSSASGGSNRYPPSRSSTLSSNGSTTFQPVTLGHRRGKSDGSALTRSQTDLPRSQPDYFNLEETESNPSDTYASMRKALRPLQQVPQSVPIPEKAAHVTNSPTRTHTRAQSIDPSRFSAFDGSVPSLPRVPQSPQSPPSSPEKPARVTNSPTRTHTRAQSIDPARFTTFDGPQSSPIPERPALATNSPTRTHTRAQSIDPSRFSAFDGSVPSLPPVSYTHLTLPTKRIV